MLQSINKRNSVGTTALDFKNVVSSSRNKSSKKSNIPAKSNLESREDENSYTAMLQAIQEKKAP